MEDLPNKPLPMPEPAGRTDLQELEDQCRSLQSLVFGLLVLMLIISGTMCIYLRRQVKNTSADLEGFRAQATNVIAAAQKSGPAVDDFIRKLSDFGKTHSDFGAVLARYGVKPAPTTSAPPTTLTPPPAKK
jgi:hypothetical protein